MAFEPTEDDCKECTYDEHGYIVDVCGECQDLGQRALDFLICAMRQAGQESTRG